MNSCLFEYFDFGQLHQGQWFLWYLDGLVLNDCYALFPLEEWTVIHLALQNNAELLNLVIAGRLGGSWLKYNFFFYQSLLEWPILTVLTLSEMQYFCLFDLNLSPL